MSEGPGLERADPRVGQTLRFEGQEWEVTDHSSYWEDEYRVSEWCCEAGEVTAYLLKEVSDERTRWFFTRQVAASAVTVPGGATAESFRRDQAPPATLTYQGGAFRHDETTEGTYEDEPGERVPKTTWEYWDAPRVMNLAVELWEDGRVDCYQGRYIEPGDVTLGGAPEDGRAGAPPAAMGLVGPARPREPERPRTARSRPGPAAPRAPASSGRSPFLIALVSVPAVYIVLFFVGWPFDRGLSMALLGAAVVGWLITLSAAPSTWLLAGAAAAGLGLVFWRHPPLTSVIGLVSLLGTPIGLAAWGRARGAAAHILAYLAAFAVGAPLLAVGAYHYFTFAPAPHSAGQFLLALGPAVVGALAALALARLVLRLAGD